MDWRRVNPSWSNAATFHPHEEDGVSGLLEQGPHVWRYEAAPPQKMQTYREPHAARTPASRPAASRPTGASTSVDALATAEAAAGSSSSQRPVPSRPTGDSTPVDACATAQAAAGSSSSQRSESYKTCHAAFDPTDYGPDYLRLTKGDRIQELEAPTETEGWAYGRLVSGDGRRSPPGWYPYAYAA